MKLENQHRVLPIGRLKGVTVDLDGVRTKADFKVIEIVDGTTPYLTFLGLEQHIINLNTRKMTFNIGSIIRGKVCRTYFLGPGGN
jgi:hypothetical protein